MRVMHVASEVAPYSKSGGLADVLGALPDALSRLGVEVTVVTPRYRSIDPTRFGFARRLEPLRISLAGHQSEVGIYEGFGSAGPKVRIFFVDHPESFDRDGLYGPPVSAGGGDFSDNARRFAILGKAALAIALDPKLNARPDVIHGHDWQAGPAMLYALDPSLPWAEPGMPNRGAPKTVFTLHNLAYQGIFNSQIISELDLPGNLFHPDGYEYWGNVSLLKAGLALAERLTTVSPRYAREIQTSEYGHGLDGLLRARSSRLHGILNGVDYRVWNPEIDSLLPAQYSADALAGKRACKAALQAEFGLPLRPDTPLCGSISRLVEQKGFDLVISALSKILADEDVQYVVLGTGDPALERALAEMQTVHPKKVSIRVKYDEGLAHRIEAGSDLFVMPSRFEPCGLNQIYSLRYGTPPIVRAVGGLDDTIVDFDAHSETGTGFKFSEYTPAALEETWRRALRTYRTVRQFTALQKRAMAQDFSWAASAKKYLDLYRS